jgi:type IV pilus assembly protein PilP
MKRPFFVSFLVLMSVVGILRAQTKPAQPPARPSRTSPPIVEQAPSPKAAPAVGAEGQPSSSGNMMGDDDMSMIQPSPEGYTYDPSGRRDPFKPYGQSQQTQAPVIPKDDEKLPPVPTDPLQMYDISQFRLVGILWQVSTPKAVVRDPVGKMHMIYRETKIGRNSGFVASIREGEVLVVEPTVSENGMPSAITRSMTLKK